MSTPYFPLLIFYPDRFDNTILFSLSLFGIIQFHFLALHSLVWSVGMRMWFDGFRRFNNGHLAFSGEGVMFCALVSIPVSIVDEPEYDQNYGLLLTFIVLDRHVCLKVPRFKFEMLRNDLIFKFK